MDHFTHGDAMQKTHGCWYVAHPQSPVCSVAVTNDQMILSDQVFSQTRKIIQKWHI
jgi:adenosylmethionine-8-amino-7-oxononanoate aminotransferase